MKVLLDFVAAKEAQEKASTELMLAISAINKARENGELETERHYLVGGCLVYVPNHEEIDPTIRIIDRNPVITS